MQKTHRALHVRPQSSIAGIARERQCRNRSELRAVALLSQSRALESAGRHRSCRASAKGTVVIADESANWNELHGRFEIEAHQPRGSL